MPTGGFTNFGWIPGPPGPQGPRGPQGPAGIGINILGSVANYAALLALPGPHDQGDAWIVDSPDGDLYVFHEHPAPGNWVNVGRIVGPQGLEGPPGPTGPQGPPGKDADSYQWKQDVDADCHKLLEVREITGCLGMLEINGHVGINTLPTLFHTVTVAGSIDIVGLGPHYYVNGVPIGMGTPAGADTEIQFNDNGAFGASPNFVYTAQGQVGIGTAIPGSPLTVNTDPFGRGIACRLYSNDAREPAFYFHKARGTEAAPLPVQVGDWCGYIGFGGQVANPPSGLADVAEIQAIVTGVNPGDLAGDLVFSTNDGTGPQGVAFERMRITSQGNVGIGTQLPQAPLEVVGERSNSSLTDSGIAHISVENVTTLQIGGTFDGNRNPLYLQARNLLSANPPAIVLNPAGGSVTVGSANYNGALFQVHSASQVFTDPDLSSYFGFVTFGFNPLLKFGFTTSGGFAWLQSSIYDAANSLLLNPLGGNVGIGTQNPQARLDVKDERVSGMWSTGWGLRVLKDGWASPSLTNNDPASQVLEHFDGGQLATGIAWNPLGGLGWIQARVSGAALPIAINPMGGNVAICTLSADDGSGSKVVIGGGISINTDNRARAVIDAQQDGVFDSGYLAFKTYAAGATPGERLRIDSQGNVGIGTQNPQANLQVHASGWTAVSLGSGDPAIQIWSQSGTSAELATGLAWTVYGGASWMQARNAGDARPLFLNPLGGEVVIGIGTNQPIPSPQLFVRQKLSADTQPGLAASSLPVACFYGDSFGINTSYPELAIFAGTSGLDGYTALQSRRSQPPVEALPLLLNPLGGNVGIGTQNPDMPLHVYGTTGSLFHVQGVGWADCTVESTTMGACWHYRTDSCHFTLAAGGSGMGDVAGQFYLRNGTTTATLLTVTSDGHTTINADGPGTGPGRNALVLHGAYGGGLTLWDWDGDWQASLYTNVFPVGTADTVTLNFAFGVGAGIGAGVDRVLMIHRNNLNGEKYFEIPWIEMTQPPAGSHRLWADPADGYTVKWTP